MKLPNFQNKIFFQLSLLLIFIMGLMFYLNPQKVNQALFLGQMEGGNRMYESKKESMSDMTPRCPNLLRQEGDMIMLYDLNQPGSDTNPAVFHNLAEYAQFVKEQQANGMHCPVLELQTEIVGSSISDMPTVKAEAGVSQSITGDVYIPPNGSYNAYDNYGEGNIGKFTKEDEIIDPDAISDNPMDPNWGGVQYSAQTLASGKYDGDIVTKPLYYNMRQGRTFLQPGMPGMEEIPPNYVPRDLIGQDIQVQHSRY